MIIRLSKPGKQLSILKSSNWRSKVFQRFVPNYISLQKIGNEQKLTNAFQTEEESGANQKVKTEKFIIAVSKEEFLSRKEEIKTYVEKYIQNGCDVGLVIDGIDSSQDIENRRIEYIYSKDEIEQICEVNAYLKLKGLSEDIRFSEFFKVQNDEEFNESWTLNQVIKANSEIKKVANDIKDKKLSPYETILYIHKYVINNFVYSLEEKVEKGERSREDTRNIVYAYEFEKICCVGFSSLIKAIIDEIENPNLKCKYSTVYIKKDKDAGNSGHAFNTIHINDEKYDIHGTYKEDATWDCKDTDFPNGTFTFCLQPFQELDCLKEKSVYRRSGVGSSRIQTSPPLTIKSWREDYWAQQYSAKPIPIDKFSDAVSVIYDMDEQVTGDEKQKIIEQIKKNSMIRAVLCLNNDAQNSFAITLQKQNLDDLKKIMIEAIKINPILMQDIDVTFRKDKDFILEIVKINPYLMYYIDDSLKIDKDFMLEMVKIDAFSAEYVVDESLLKNKEFIFDAFKINSNVIYWSHDFCKDEEFMIEIIKLDPLNIGYIHINLTNNEAFMTKVMNLDVMKSEKIMLILAETNSSYLKYSPLSKDKEFMLKAVKVNHNVLLFSKFLHDTEFLLEAIKNNPALMEHGVMFDWDFLIEALKANPSAFEYLYDGYKNKESFIADLLEAMPDFLTKVDYKFDEEFLNKVYAILKERKENQYYIN